MAKSINILFKIVLGTILFFILFLLVIKIGGFMDGRKSNGELAKILESGTRTVQFSSLNTSNDIEISYVKVSELGRPKNLAILFVHGSPGSLSAYQSYLIDSFLISKANLYAVDRPGFGLSDYGVAEPSLKVQSKALAEIIQTFKEERVVLVGHSFGCAVISRLAMDYPNLADGLVNIAGTISSEAEPSNWWRKIIDLGLVKLFIPRDLITCNSEMLPLKSELRKMENQWQDLNIPISIIHGSADWIVDYDNLTQTIQHMEYNENVTFTTLVGKGHLIIWTMHDRMRLEIIKLLDRVSVNEKFAK